MDAVRVALLREVLAGTEWLGAARRGETLLVVSPAGPDCPLLERVYDVRRAGATVLALGAGEGELASMAHESLAVPEGAELDLDTVQHLVSAAAGENALPAPRGNRRLRDRLYRLAEQLTAPPPARW